MSAISEVVKPGHGIDPGEIVQGAFYHERERMLQDAGLEQDRNGNYVIPNTGWSENYFSMTDRANYLAYLEQFSPWVIKSPFGTREGAVVSYRKLPIMPTKKIKALIDTIQKVKDDYPLVDDETHSRLEMELQDKAWGETEGKEFLKMVKKLVEPYFEGKYTRSEEPVWDIVSDLMDENKNLIYEFFRECSENGDEWSYEGQGGPSLNLERLRREAIRHHYPKEWAKQIMQLRWPEDPRQMKFKFAEEVVRRLLAGCTTMLEASGAATLMATTLLEDKGPHKFSCVYIKIPAVIGDKVVAWGKQQISNDVLFVDEDGGMGREEEQHVTVKYGLHDSMPSDELLNIFASTAPFNAQIEPISLFRNEKYDVVKMGVSSPQLREFNRRVSTECPCTDTFPDYNPHITLAYVKPGTCDRLEGTSPFDNPVKMGVTDLRKEGEFKADSVVFSSHTGIKKDYPIGPRKPEKESVKENEEPPESDLGIDPAEIARLGGATGQSIEHRQLRRKLSRELVRAVHVTEKQVGQWSGGAELRIVFDRGPNQFLEFASLGVLAQALRQWRNLYGAQLYVAHKPAGKVEYSNPVLKELAR